MSVRFQQQQQEQQQDPGEANSASGANGEPAAAEAPQGQPGKVAGGSKGKAGNRAARPTRTLEQRSALADRALARITTGDEPEEKPADKKPEGKAEDKPEPKAEGKKPEERPAVVELSEGAKTAIAELLKSGKLAELATLAGVDGKAVDASNAKLRLVRERDEAATVKETKAATLVNEAKSIREECRKEFGDPHKARKAVDAGEWVEAIQWVEKILEVDFATLTRHVAAATKGMDPKALEAWKKDRELKAREAALAAKETKTAAERTEQERTAKATKTIRAKLAEHPALKLSGADMQIFRLLEESFDEKTGQLGMGYKQAADKVLEDFDAQALALGYVKPGTAPKPEEKPAKKPEEPAPGKKPFAAPPGASAPEPGKRRGSTFEERAARADRAFGRSRVL